ncbi:hypothetical protein K402DRAFT_393068 [Aulographum hederae CBS 113979]|uniref:ATP synthase protein 8 n=1 Tax=Aulographum hederae CBS 113979 TaxID=1176131 RepID=A0A6G1H2X7_9PEZI|nr:hypothetical protein K402DRAFT_393068 [Aulographum hederae CBS 113979]
MSSARIMVRPLVRAAVQRQPATLAAARPAFAAIHSKAIAPVMAQQQKPSVASELKRFPGMAKKPTSSKEAMQALQAAMPQLVPFYFVNEVVYAFITIPILVYLFSKYFLPQRVRVFCARLFISKL